MYETYDKFRTNLLKAIHECSEGFGFAQACWSAIVVYCVAVYRTCVILPVQSKQLQECAPVKLRVHASN